jgi:hypothetical protein
VKKAKEGHINLGSVLTIDEIVPLKLKIEKELKKNDVLFLASEEITAIDLTGIQLLQFYISKAQRINKELRLNLAITNEQRIILEKNGFINLLETVFA